MWDVDTGEQIHLLTDPLWKKHNHIDNSYDVKYVSFSQDGRTLASGIRSGDIYLWDTETGEQKQILSGHTLWIDKMIFSEDGQPIASNGVDGTVLLWENGSVSKE